MKIKSLGLGIFFTLSSMAYGETSSYLRLYGIPSDSQVQWASPWTSVKSLLFSRLIGTQNPYGDIYSELQCQGDQKALVMGLVPGSFHAFSPLIFEGRGLGFFFMEQAGEILNSLPKDMGKSRSADFKLNLKQCLRIKHFWEEFSKLPTSKNFGLPHRPLMAEGGTGASVAASSLEAIGILGPELVEKWKRTLLVPENLAGEPLKDQFVSIFSFMNKTWEEDFDKSVVFSFWDPQLIFEWMGTERKIIDQSRLPAPEGQLWKQALDPIYQKKK